ncbi:MAG: Tim44/TimA family putative adaptor protein [Sphingobacteriia bacterium]|nr:Tim44/TimA family putative adaptor protein [Sphingobacteriia bacterium]
MDIFFFALVAAFIAYRYYYLLGKKDDTTDDLESRKNDLAKEFKFFDFTTGEPEQAQTLKVIEPVSTSSNSTIVETMNKINQIYPNFTESYFINGAKKLFELILKSYVEGDLNAVKQLISTSLTNKLQNEINRRNLFEERLEISLVAIDSIEIMDASIDNNVAFITLKILSEQIINHYDKNGDLTSGNPTLTEQIEDIWKFSKDLSAQGPEWVLEDIS